MPLQKSHQIRIKIPTDKKLLRAKKINIQISTVRAVIGGSFAGVQRINAFSVLLPTYRKVGWSYGIIKRELIFKFQLSTKRVWVCLTCEACRRSACGTAVISVSSFTTE